MGTTKTWFMFEGGKIKWMKCKKCCKKTKWAQGKKYCPKCAKSFKTTPACI